VLSTLFYLDTIRLRLASPLSSAEWRKLRHITGDRCFPGRAISFPNQRYRFPIILSPRPTTQALQYLAEVCPDHWLSHVHIAADSIVDDAAQAERLQRWQYHHTIFRWRGDRQVGLFIRGGTTHYFSRRGDTRNAAIYSDRLSKIARLPTCHFELRLRGRHCRQWRSLLDLLNADLAAVIRHHCGIAFIAHPRLRRVIDTLALEVMKRSDLSRLEAERFVGWFICHGILQDDTNTPSFSFPESIPCQQWWDCAKEVLERLRSSVSVDLFRSPVLSTRMAELIWPSDDYGAVCPSPRSAS
jgi:hypothetical protein